jgi:hypothetical protein
MTTCRMPPTVVDPAEPYLADTLRSGVEALICGSGRALGRPRGE